MNEKIKIYRLYNDANVPCHETDNEIGFGIYAHHYQYNDNDRPTSIGIVAGPKSKILAHTGIKVVVPYNYFAVLMVSDNLAKKGIKLDGTQLIKNKGIQTGKDEADELVVRLVNTNDCSVTLDPSEIVARAVLIPYTADAMFEVCE